MKTSDVLAYYGPSKKEAVIQLSQLLNVSQQTIYHWAEYVPESSAVKLHFLSGGKLSYSPDDYVGISSEDCWVHSRAKEDKAI